VIHGDLEDIPLFARAGAIVPLAQVKGWGSAGVENPQHLIVRVFPGKEGSFEMYEDDGWSTGYRKGKYWVTKFEMKMENGEIQFSMKSVGNGREKLPEFLSRRTFEVEFFGMNSPNKIRVESQKYSEISTSSTKYDQKSKILRVTLNVDTLDTTKIAIEGTWSEQKRNIRDTCLEMVRKFRLQSVTKQSLYESIDKIIQKPETLLEFTPTLSHSQSQALFETILDTGIQHTKVGSIDSLVVWNYDTRTTSTTCECGEDVTSDGLTLTGPVPSFKVVDVKKEFGQKPWRLMVNYCGGFKCEYKNKL